MGVPGVITILLAVITPVISYKNLICRVPPRTLLATGAFSVGISASVGSINLRVRNRWNIADLLFFSRGVGHNIYVIPLGLYIVNFVVSFFFCFFSCCLIQKITKCVIDFFC